MDFGVLLTLGVLYAVLSFLGKVTKGGTRQQGPAAPQRKRVPGRPETLEDLLADMRGQLEPEPELEPIRELAQAEARSLELEVTRAERQVTDFRHGADELVAERLSIAEARNRVLDQRLEGRFDRKVDRLAPVVLVDQVPHRNRLREAMVWNEILGLPKGLQED